MLKALLKSGSGIVVQCRSGFGSRSGSRSSVLMTLKCVQLRKLSLILNLRTALFFYISMSPRRTSNLHRRSLQCSVENIQHFETWNFFTFLCHFCPPGLESVTMVESYKDTLHTVPVSNTVFWFFTGIVMSWIFFFQICFASLMLSRFYRLSSSCETGKAAKCSRN